MLVVIIAGGSGTRLWPLSTPDYPKHLLKLGGDDYSLLQRTYLRAKLLTNQIYIVSEIGHIDHVKKQLREVPDDNFIIEPALRGTANCLIAALVHIAARHTSDEPIAILSADHYIRDNIGFVHSFRLASEISAKEKRIVLVGVEPEYPSTGFGYIQKADMLPGKHLVYSVGGFKEKPSFAVAKKYLHSGQYLWNCGYFVGSLDTFIGGMRLHSAELYDNYKRLSQASAGRYQSTYLSFKNDTIDYALIEKLDDLLVVPASFDWMDVGSFNDLHKAVESDQDGNYVSGSRIATDEVENSFIENHESKPLVVIGLDNVVVVNTPQGILIARKDLSQKVGQLSKNISPPAKHK